MKLLRKHVEKDGSGSVGLRLEQEEDLWHGKVAKKNRAVAVADRAASIKSSI